MKKETRWVIVGKYGLYVGQWFTRKEAIRKHCEDKGEPWEHCKRLGDYATKATITYKKQ